MKKYLSSLLMALAVAAVSCTSVVPEETWNEGTKAPFKMNIADADFEDGDRIGLYMFESSGSPFGGEVLADNMLIRMDNSEAVLEGELFFPDTQVDICAYYPYWDDNIITDNHISVYVFEDQRNSRDYRESDQKYLKLLNYENTGKPVEMVFERLMSRLSFELKPGNGFSSADELKDCEIIVPNIKYHTSISLEDAELIEPEGKRDFFPYVGEKQVADGKVSGIYSLVIPQTLYKGMSIANITVGGDVFRCILDEDFTMRKGVSYTITITLDKSETKSDSAACVVSGLSITEDPVWE